LFTGTPRYTKKAEKRVSVKEGQDITLPCEVEATGPKVETSWTYNSKPVDKSKFTIDNKGMTIKNAKKTDSGYYGCRAVNSIGENYFETLVQVA
jgi:hypothetical protein